MFRSPRLTLALAIALTVAAGALWLAAFRTLTGARIDATIMTGFVGLGGPRVDRLADAVAHLADPTPFALATVAIVTAALVRRRPWLAVMTGVVLIGANATTQALKVLTAEPRLASAMTGGYVDAASWPSGHATAAMVLALCLIAVSPARLRPLAVVLGSALALAVGYSVLLLGWHFASDVVGAFCVAAAWALAALAVLSAPERDRTLPVLGALLALGVVALIAGSALAQLDPAAVYEQPNAAFAAAAVVIGVGACIPAAGLAAVLSDRQ